MHLWRPAACGQRSQQGGSSSYRLRFGKYLRAKFRGQVGGSQQVNMNTKHGFKFDLQAAQVEQRRPWKGIDQQVKVTSILVCAVQNRAEDTRIPCAKAASRFTYGSALQVER
jgi:hypothetical protein